MPIIKMIYGGAGAGKTEALLRELETALQTYDVKEIAYISFTRKGAYQGVNLAKTRFNLKSEDCVYFRTLHSLCFRILSAQKTALITSADKDKMLAILNKAIDGNIQSKERDVIEKLEGIRASKEQDELDFKQMRRKFIDAEEYRVVAKAYDKYKKDNKKLDYTDLLLLAAKKETALPVKLLLLDEAQDLTPIQWKIVNIFFADADKWIIAGDANQAIFEWAGADVEQYQNLRYDESVTLEVSHRCCNNVWTAANIVYSMLSRPSPTAKRGSGEDGFVHVNNSGEISIDVLHTITSKGTVYLLANYFRDYAQYVSLLVKLGLPFRVNRRTAFTEAETTHPFAPSHTLNALKKLYSLMHSKDEFFNVVTCCEATSGKDWDLRYKRRWAKENGLTAIHDIKDSDGEEQWLVSFLNKREKDAQIKRLLVRAYYNGNIVRNDANVIISTVHQVKGGEADYVMYDLSLFRTDWLDGRAVLKTRDAALRLAYVAITRARHGVCLFAHNHKCNIVSPSEFVSLGRFDVLAAPQENETAERIIKEQQWEVKDDETN